MVGVWRRPPAGDRRRCISFGRSATLPAEVGGQSKVKQWRFGGAFYAACAVERNHTTMPGARLLSATSSTANADMVRHRGWSLAVVRSGALPVVGPAARF